MYVNQNSHAYQKFCPTMSKMDYKGNEKSKIVVCPIIRIYTRYVRSQGLEARKL